MTTTQPEPEPDEGELHDEGAGPDPDAAEDQADQPDRLTWRDVPDSPIFDIEVAF